MGCDIHSFAEKKNSDGTYSPVFYTPFEDRHYGLFAFLADVRNYSQIEPLSQPRGMPADASQAIVDELKSWEDDAHSVSYFTLAELVRVDYEKKIEDHRSVVTESLRDFLGTDYFYSLKRMNDLAVDRVIFWFDN